MLGGVHGRQPSDFTNWSFSANTPMDPRQLSDDFRDFLISLNAAGVEYLLLGGHAVAHYGYVRPTTDLDIWVAVSEVNAEKLVTAIRSFFDADLPGLEKGWFLDMENVTHFGARPNYIEILPKVSGLEFRDAYQRALMVELDGIPTRLIGLSDLLINKRATGRTKDLADFEKLSKQRE